MPEILQFSNRRRENQSCPSPRRIQRLALVLLLSAWGVCYQPSQPRSAYPETRGGGSPASPATLDEIRLTMDKWIETQQVISKERKDWQQGKDILLGRLEPVKKEIAALQEQIKKAETSAAEANKKRNQLKEDKKQLESAGAQLSEFITKMEEDIHLLRKQIPEPVLTKLLPLYQRIPDDPGQTRVSVAERFQNVLGILNELNKANSEITVGYEVHTLADGKPSEVQTFYIGLAQAYYVSPAGAAGIGRPSAEGWTWEPSNSIARDVLSALEILQGKQSPAFVALPVKIQ